MSVQIFMRVIRYDIKEELIMGNNYSVFDLTNQELCILEQLAFIDEDVANNNTNLIRREVIK